ncbi:MAG TPA: DNA cytosine methyltransferase, partial [Pyrinomonadaceae bacterium]|nr:DNA cytosine methyltransferase [Pyrinomonadaceae bacterium]
MIQTEFSRLREQAGVTIEALAELVGFSKRTLYRWERGEVVPRRAAITLLEEMLAQKRGNYSAASFTFIDLFAGVGGLRRGFESIGGKCVFTSEWNLYAQLTYKANYNCD